MKRLARASALLVVIATLSGCGSTGNVKGTASRATPLLEEITAAHHNGFDRIVFRFAGALPSERRVGYVRELIADPSGRPISIAGQAVLRVRMYPAAAHTDTGHITAPGQLAFATPNLISVVRSGDFEAVLSYGIAVAKRSSVHMFTLKQPSRVVIDVSAPFRTVQKRVYFFNQRNFLANRQPFFSAVLRPVLPSTPASGLMDRLFAGPTATERARGLRLLRSKATGYRSLAVSAGLARVRLTGGCSSGGSTVSIADEIFPTLKQLPGVRHVKLLDPSGHTATPVGDVDSRPFCLEP